MNAFPSPATRVRRFPTFLFHRRTLDQPRSTRFFRQQPTELLAGAGAWLDYLLFGLYLSLLSGMILLLFFLHSQFAFALEKRLHHATQVISWSRMR